MASENSLIAKPLICERNCQFRKVVPLQDTDPLAYSCPLVGLWVYSGTDELRPDSVHVWAGCVRYLHNDSIAERVSPALLTFLVLVACRSSYAFYECQATVRPNSFPYDVLC